MFPDSPFAVPVSSYQHPVKPPGVDPDTTPLIYVGFNFSYLAYIIGSLKQLLLQTTWDVSDSSSLNLAQQRAFTLINLFANYVNTAPVLGSAGADTEDIPMIRQDPANPCLLQTSIDGVNWCTFADISKCVPSIAQPGSGSGATPPAGQSQQTCSSLNANSTLLLPSLVSSGDTITLDSASGAWWDGGEFDFGPLWRLPNGDQYVGGIDVGFPRVTGTDPAVSANHMSVIAAIGSTPVYVALPIGTPVTVPGGITNAQVVIQVNDSAIGNNQGSALMCLTVKNNATVEWCRTIDLRFSPGGWADCHLSGDGPATWSPGVGWVGSAGMTAHNFNCEICLSFAGSFSLSRLVVISDKTGASGTNNTDEAFYDVPATGTRLYLNSGCAGICTDDSGTVSDTATSLTLYHNSGDGTTMVITGVTIYGSGAVPPELAAWTSC